eukprot:gnl/MRDRNA2_/MRDRNA2_28270_c0_seq1.p1 gnl/MRDRNA2_/MRDRNA2_28270_c0~~gnl/MRDRNA2_/MRDRNA2_28270_c0_seq1.p1  ORF type:complete len:291 (+),score=50.84 gnl/MRDRNA2_/MRDRNA2_28270_c0_seq1:96-968(+)
MSILTACMVILQISRRQGSKIEFASDTQDSWKDALLATHNLPRLRTGLPVFQWNDALAVVAREWLQSDAMSSQCSTSGVIHSSKGFRTEHPASPFYYLGETAASKELPAKEERWDAVQLAQEAISRWGEPMVLNISYGRWGSACTVDKVHVAIQDADQRLGLAMAIAEGFFQSLWAETQEVGCEAAFCGVNDDQTYGNETWKTFLLVCEYGPGGNVKGELPFSPTTASIAGLSSSPCDGPLTDSEWLHWERWDAEMYPLPSGHSATSNTIEWQPSLIALGFSVFLDRLIF